jgi:dTDP-4-dehydrorhamnose reductase
MTPPLILLLGKNGQIGADLAELLPVVGEVAAFDRHQLDLSQTNDIRRAIRELRPQLIVNAVAYTAVDQAEKEEYLAYAINAEAPATIAEEAKKVGAAVVHYSTDYVFDGLKGSPYEEDDPTGPINAYGRSKLAGEEAIRNSGAAYLIFRTAWVYTTRGRNFLLTILRLTTQREELRIVADQFGSPTWSREIARGTTSALRKILGSGDVARFREFSGTYHITAGGVATWFDFAQSIVANAGGSAKDLPWLSAALQGRPILTRRITPIPTAEYPTPARRPPYSVLSNQHIREVFDVCLPNWQDQLQHVFERSERVLRQ